MITTEDTTRRQASKVERGGPKLFPPLTREGAVQLVERVMQTDDAEVAGALMRLVGGLAEVADPVARELIAADAMQRAFALSSGGTEAMLNFATGRADW
jgi:hypothetical protein